MEKEKLDELKKVANMAVSEMIDKMFTETEVNDTFIAINVVGHDIKGSEASLNQFSTEININGSIFASMPKFIRYPEYFGTAVRELIKRAKYLKDDINNFVSKKPEERLFDESSEINQSVWNRLHNLENGLQHLESTGFSENNIRRIIETIRTGGELDDEPYEEEPEGTEDEDEEQEVQEQIIETVEDYNGYSDAQMNGDIQDMPLPVNNMQQAQMMIRERFAELNVDREYINGDRRVELLQMAEFEDIPQGAMIIAINRFNMLYDENRRQELYNQMTEQREGNTVPTDQAPEIGPALDEAMIEHARIMDQDNEEIHNIHDEAAIGFIEQWYERPIDEIGAISIADFNRMITNIETTEAPGIYQFALDRVVGAHNARVTFRQINELQINTTTVLEGTPHRIDSIDAALRLFAHVTGTTNPNIDTIGRYVSDGIRQQLYDSCRRNNIPQNIMDWVINAYNLIHREQSMRDRFEEYYRQANIFISTNYQPNIVIDPDERILLISRGELLGIDIESMEVCIDDHNLEAQRIQTVETARAEGFGIREAEEINREDLQAAEEHYGQLTRRSITDTPPSFIEDPNRNPHNEDDRN